MHASLRRPALRFNAYLGLLLAPFALLPWSSAHAIDVNRDCAAAYGSTITPAVGMVTATTPSLPRPLKGKLFIDQDFHACVVRATDHAVEPPNNFARSDYSRRQAFNADNTRFIVYASGGAWHMYDANTLAYIKQLSGPNANAEPQWDATNPNTLYYIPNTGGLTLLKLDVTTNTTTTAANFASRLPWTATAKVSTHGEGSPSADGRYWCFVAENSSAGILGMFTYDLQTQTILGTKSLSTKPDNISMSPSGRSCVVSGTTAWNPTFTASRTLASGTPHSDMALGANGEDYFVYVDQVSTGNLIMVNVDTGVSTKLLSTWINSTATSYHLSGKGFARPGWILMGTFNHTAGKPENYVTERVMAIELKANPRIINLAHHHEYYNGYWTQPHATISRDFTHALFNSNWGTTSDMDVDAYMIRLPDNLFGTTTTTADTTAPTATASEVGTSGTVTLAATASDNVGVSRVDFWIDGVLKGSDATSAYALAFNSTTLANGSHSLVAKAYDAAGNVGTSTAVGFSTSNSIADTTAPSVTAAVSVATGSITMSATAGDNVGVSRVEFWIDGVLKGSDSTGPYSLYWSTTQWWPGSTHSLVAKAYDTAGNVGSSTAVSFTIGTTSSGADTTAPSVTAAVSVVTGSITMKATASDNVGVTKVEFWIDGVLKGYDTTSAYSLYWDTAQWWPGSTHSLVAKAYDAAGNVRSSAPVSFVRY